MNSDQAHEQLPEPNVPPEVEPVSPSNKTYTSLVGINEAARLVGKGKQQIYRDIRAGKISWMEDPSGKKVLQIADLDRLYKLKPQGVTSHSDQVPEPNVIPNTTQVTIEVAIENAQLKAKLEAQKEVTRLLTDQIEDLKEQRDHLRSLNQNLTLRLPAPPRNDDAQQESAISGSPPARKNWLQRLFGS